MAPVKRMTLIQYLADGRPFLEVVNAAFGDCMGDIAAEGIYLYQFTQDRARAKVIAQVVHDAYNRKPEVEYPVKDLPFLEDSMMTYPLEGGGCILTSPIFIGQNVAMHIVVATRQAEFSKEETRVISQMTLILQSVALQRNFQESLTYSYRFLESTIDQIPIGLSVLSKDYEFLMMNQIAVEDQGVQSVMRKAIARLLETGDRQMPEFFDEETGFWYDVVFHQASWIDGSPAIICTTIDITEKMKNQQRIEYQANNDYLTGLFNRMKCERDLTQIIEKTAAKGQKGVVLFLDLDNFKQVNDGLGHQYGDVLLQEIANGIMSIPQLANHCYRMGGDEFVIVIMPEYFQEITQIVEQISHMFNEPWDLMGVEYYCTMSMGLAIFPDHGSHMQEIVKKADYAMYEAKKGGKNRYLWYTPDDPNRIDTENMEEAVRSMVDEGCKDFTLHYQPVFNEKQELVGAEALVRIQSDRYGKMLPAEFLPMADYLGLMNRIGDHVLKEACEQLGLWMKEIRPDFKMHINVAGTQLMQTKAVEIILKNIEAAGANPSNVVLEVSEQMELRDEDKAFSTLEILYAHGVGIAMDDFGTGRQSITMLQRMKAGYIKFSHKFLQNDTNPAMRDGMARVIHELAQLLGAKVGFVGVETSEEHAYAVAHGASLLEGYYYGTPLSPEEFTKKYQ